MKVKKKVEMTNPHIINNAEDKKLIKQSFFLLGNKGFLPMIKYLNKTNKKI